MERQVDPKVIDHLREFMAPALLFVASSTASVVSTLTSQDTWITVATASGAFLSLMKGIHIAWQMYEASKEPEQARQQRATREAIREFAEEYQKHEKLRDELDKELRLLSEVNAGRNRYPFKRKK